MRDRVQPCDYLVRGQDYHLQPGRAGQPPRLDARPLHRPGDQLPQPALDPGSLPPAQPGGQGRLRRHAPALRPPDYLPVDEQHPLHPVDVNGINKIAGEWYHILYNNVYGIRTTSLRLTNTYGPRQYVRQRAQGFIGWFIRLAVRATPITIFGDGEQLRDFNYVDDVVEAFLLAAANDAANGQVFNLGGDADQRAPR